jgi:hypothetical protein
MSSCKDCVAHLLGACDGDYCAPERVSLQENAAYLAAQGGHTLSDFVQDKGRPLWRAHCQHCGLEIACTLDPEPGHPDIFGPLLDTPCPHADEGENH